MSRLSATMRAPNYRSAVETVVRDASSEMERAALIATDRAAMKAQAKIRAAMQGAGLGRLGNAFGATSDLRDAHGVHRTGDDGFSASGTVFIRSRSKRTLGAIEAYTQGASILPRAGRWLWIPTPEATRLIGSGRSRQRLTPDGYRKAGEPMGPLVLIKGINGRPLLAVQNVGVSEVGARGGRVRGRTKTGKLRKGDRAKAIAVLFIGIPSTSRAARVNVHSILEQSAAELPALFEQALNLNAKGR